MQAKNCRYISFTSQNIFLHDKLRVAQLFSNFPLMLGTRALMKAPLKTLQWPVSWVTWIQSTPHYPIHLAYILIMPFHISPTGLFRPGITAKSLYKAIFALMRVTWLTHLAWPHHNKFARYCLKTPLPTPGNWSPARARAQGQQTTCRTHTRVGCTESGGHHVVQLCCSLHRYRGRTPQGNVTSRSAGLRHFRADLCWNNHTIVAANVMNWTVLQKNKQKYKNSVSLSPQANYTDWRPPIVGQI
jgi:hypothetical protein